VIDVTPFPSGGSYAQMASGAYNDYYKQLGASAASLNGGFPVVIRLAWEFNGNWYDHSVWGPSSGHAQVTTATFVAAWRNAYTNIKAGAGAHPERAVVDWSLSALDQKDGNPSPTAFWPGDNYVDIVGIDNYDFSWVKASSQSAFDSGAGAQYSTLYNFAQSHGKMLALDEWGGADGGSNGGDNPTYISCVLNWVRAHKAGLAYEMYFETADPNNVHNALFGPTILPKAAAEYTKQIKAEPGDR
jgi:beta-mannanase